MSLIIGGILSTLHGTQGQPAEKRLFFCSLNTGNQFLQFPRMNFFFSHLDVIAKTCRDHRQLLDLFQIRVFMDSIQKWNLSPVKFFRDRFIGTQHKILDHAGCHIPVIWHNVRRFSVFIQKDLALLKIKINGTLFFSSFTENGSQFFHIAKHRDQWLVPFAGLFLFVYKNIPYIRIVHPLCYLYH